MRVDRIKIEKLAYVAREKGDTKAFERGIDIFRGMSVTLTKEFDLDEEDTTLLGQYEKYLDDYDWTDYPFMTNRKSTVV